MTPRVAAAAFFVALLAGAALRVSVLAVGVAAVAASRGWPAVAGVLLAAAVMTKPQGIFVAPVVALALWNAGDPDRALTREIGAALAGAIAVGALLLPLLAAGTTYAMFRSVA